MPDTEARPDDPLCPPENAEEISVTASEIEARRLLHEPDAQELGRLACSPAEIAWPGWRAVFRRVAIEMMTDRVSLVAAGCAFYGTLALFPAISMLISVYGLMFDPQTVLPQLAVLQGLLPEQAYKLIAGRVQTLVSRPATGLTLGLLFSTAFTLWSSASGAKSVIGALNLAYEEREGRGFLAYQLTAFVITLCAIFGTALGVAMLVGMPAALRFFGFRGHQEVLIRASSLGLLAVAVLVALSLLYRYGPHRRVARWQWVTPGSLVATAIWIIASVLFTTYLANFSTYDTTYGPLGTVVAVMMWFYVTAYAVLLGAELNAELELQTVRDSTQGAPRPIGHRGAYVADHVAEGSRR